jgi:hypothetical protein
VIVMLSSLMRYAVRQGLVERNVVRDLDVTTGPASAARPNRGTCRPTSLGPYARGTLAEAAMLARHANAKVTAQVYGRLSRKAKAEVAAKLVNADVGS